MKVRNRIITKDKLISSYGPINFGPYEWNIDIDSFSFTNTPGIAGISGSNKNYNKLVSLHGPKNSGPYEWNSDIDMFSFINISRSPESAAISRAVQGYSDNFVSGTIVIPPA